MPPRYYQIGLNAQLLSGQRSYRAAGIHRYILGLLAHLPAADPRFRYTVFTGDDAPVPDRAITVQRTSLRTERPLPRILWEQCVQPAFAGKLDLFHAFAYASPALVRKPCVVTVHDLSFLRNPERFRFANRAYLRLFTGLSVKRAARVIAVSEHTKRDVMNVYSLPAEKIDVVYSGLDEHFKRPSPQAIADFRAAHGLPERFILYLGTIEPRKNLSTLIRAYGKVRPEGVKLVCAGGRGWMYQDVFQTVEELRLSRDVIFPGFLPDDDLPLWYSAADVFVYPSAYEGFGLPVIEALACGVQTITTNGSALPEAAGAAALLVPPDDSAALADSLARLLNDPALQSELAARGPKQAARFNWPDAACNTARVDA
ncbi:MAG TPA: glycosyltransferase family 1 protein, partial [Anaerolineales bacterium]|nr:glycosyltransferase family 1 protein [Anaerolineales bacterium]